MCLRTLVELHNPRSMSILVSSHTRLEGQFRLTPDLLEEDMTVSTGEERNTEAGVLVVLHTSGLVVHEHLQMEQRHLTNLSPV